MRNCSHCNKYVLMEDEIGRDTKMSHFDFEKIYKMIFKAYRSCPIHGLKNEHKGNGKPKGIWAGTLTKSTTDEEITEEDMINAIKKIFTQKTCPVKRYIWYLEYTAKNVPHIHFIYECESAGRIHQKVFKRYWKIWDESVKVGKGHRGGYHRLCESELAYKEYISKDGSQKSENKWLPISIEDAPQDQGRPPPTNGD